MNNIAFMWILIIIFIFVVMFMGIILFQKDISMREDCKNICFMHGMSSEGFMGGECACSPGPGVRYYIKA